VNENEAARQEFKAAKPAKEFGELDIDDLFSRATDDYVPDPCPSTLPMIPVAPKVTP
jgi:hypothetical protein